MHDRELIKQDRWRSPALWAAICAFVVFVVRQIFNVDIAPILDEALDLITVIMVLLGIWNDPTTKNHI